VELIKPDTARGEYGYGAPHFLPDGQQFIYFSFSDQPAHQGLFLRSLTGSTTKKLLASDSTAAYGAGHLFFARGEALMAQSFDSRALTLTGEPFQVVSHVKVSASVTYVSASDNGVLIYQGGSSPTQRVVHYDRSGKQLGTVGEPGQFSNPSLSPDGKRLAVGVRGGQQNLRDIWLYDLARETKSRFTFDPADDLNPVWTADGSRILFSSTRQVQRDIYVKKVDSAVAEELVLTSATLPKNVNDVSPDGNWLIFDIGALAMANSPTKNDLWLLPLTGERRPTPLLQTQFNEQSANISPDGRWVAYTSDESRRGEVYVQAFPQPDGSWQISVGGGVDAQWRGDGKELFYISPEGKLMAVAVKAGAGSFAAGIPKALFAARFSSGGRNRFVVTDDGQQFLIITRTEDANPAPINVVINWAAEVKR
jgi:eukaryotic-like serine/threonine-protein kinase